MRRGTFSILLLALFFLLCTVKVASQELSPVAVKSRESTKTVVVLNVLKDGKMYELTCNQGYSGCNDLQAGKYTMNELPKNHGLYECRNVEIYPDATDEPDQEKLLGSYCMTEKPRSK